MKKNKIFGITLITLIAIGASFMVFSKQQVSTKHVSADTTNAQTFVNQIGETARSVANEHDLYASVMIAQAILESNYGQSGLSQAPHYNYFGIKGSYNGSSVNLWTWEDDGKGNPYEVIQAFRSYPSAYESLEDYASVLSSDTYLGAHKSNTLSYQDATAALTGVYATDTSYNSKLNYIIEAYGLTAYDTPAANANQTSDTAQATTSNQVWNPHRQAYTDQETLDLDDAWAASHPNT